MNVKKLAVGAGAVLAADLAAGYLPAAIDFAGLPVRKALAATGGVFAAGKLGFGGSTSLKSAMLHAVGAVAAAELATKFVPASVTVGPFDLVRLGAGAVGIWGVDKITG